jgi:hypothetical protein
MFLEPNYRDSMSKTKMTFVPAPTSNITVKLSDETKKLLGAALNYLEEVSAGGHFKIKSGYISGTYSVRDSIIKLIGTPDRYGDYVNPTGFATAQEANRALGYILGGLKVGSYPECVSLERAIGATITEMGGNILHKKTCDYARRELVKVSKEAGLSPMFSFEAKALMDSQPLRDHTKGASRG